jgi:type II secretory ATPase GspE/PulE/Tfp pilus assembly ATPase PilB-like protein
MSTRFVFPQLSDVGFVDEPPIVAFCNGLLADALNLGYSHLHVRAPHVGSESFDVCAQKDGEWIEYMQVPSAMHKIVLRRLKVMAGIDLVRSMSESGTIPVGRAHEGPIALQVTTQLSGGAEEVLIDLPVLPGLP